MRQAATLVIALAMVSPAGADEAAPRFGIADLGAADAQGVPVDCATIPGPPLAPGQAVLLVLFDPPRWMPAGIAARRSRPCLLEGLQQAPAYELRLPPGEAPERDLAIAVIAPGAAPGVEQGEVVLHAPGQGAPVLLRRCAGAEGVHLLAWRRDRPLWREYVALGYEVEPTCPSGPIPVRAAREIP